MNNFILLAQEADTALSWFVGPTTFLASPYGRVLTYDLLALAGLSFGIFLLLPPRGRGRQFSMGALISAAALIVLLVPSLTQLSPSLAFLLLEGLAVLGGLGTITARSPVYSAIWFASALLAIGGTLLLSGAQFLGLATVAVYAGAIVVTFLFVLMLAQPEGKAIYDRLGWGWFPTLCASLAGTSVAGIVIVSMLSGIYNDSPTAADQLHTAVTEAISAIMARAEDTPESDLKPDPATVLRKVRLATDPSGAAVLQVDLAAGSRLLSGGEAPIAQAIRQQAGPQLVPPACRIEIVEKDILTRDHVAHLGKELFGRHLISIEVAGVLLLVALVGAIAMAIHGNELKLDVPREGVSLR